MKIGIFGGTFDPPHMGHKKYAVELKDRLSLDKLIVIPTGIPPHKARDNSAPDEDRLNMLKILFGGYEDIEINDMEINRGGKSYTYETVTLLHEEYPDDELIFLLGSDMLLSFHTWRNPDVILSHVKICAVSRTDDINEQGLREYVENKFPQKGDRFITCTFDPIDVSSTRIRNSIRDGKSVDGLVDKKVLKYMEEKELYR